MLIWQRQLCALLFVHWQMSALCSPSGFSTDARVGWSSDLRDQNRPTMSKQLHHSAVLNKSVSVRWIVLDGAGAGDGNETWKRGQRTVVEIKISRVIWFMHHFLLHKAFPSLIADNTFYVEKKIESVQTTNGLQTRQCSRLHSLRYFIFCHHCRRFPTLLIISGSGINIKGKMQKCSLKWQRARAALIQAWIL